MNFLSLISPDDPATDIDAAEPRDLMADAFLRGLLDRFNTPSTAFADLLSDRRPRQKRSLDRLYADIERRRGYIPHPGTEDDGEPAGVTRSYFEQLVAGGSEVVDDEDESATPRLAALFEEDDGPQPIPISRETFGPLLRQVRPGFRALGKFGYNEPITDPYGDLMRNALRRLVRTS